MRARTCLGAFLIATVAITTACSSDPDSAQGGAAGSCVVGAPVDDRPIRIVTTVAPITNIVAVVAAGAPVEIDGIVPEGVNSHTFEPEPGTAAALESADVVFLNGLELELPTKRLASANADGGVVICELGNEILPEADYIFDFSFPESAGAPNPHLWTNPPMTRAYAGVVRDVLSAADPANADLYEANDRDFAVRVAALDSAVRTATSTIPPERRLLLTYHDAYAYFADEYDWTVVGAVQPSSFDEPTPRDVAALVEQIRDLGISTIFGSEVFPSPVLRQIANETGADYVDDLRDDDLPGEPGDDEHSWLGLMRVNLVTIVEALGGDAAAVRAVDISPSSVDIATYAS